MKRFPNIPYGKPYGNLTRQNPWNRVLELTRFDGIAAQKSDGYIFRSAQLKGPFPCANSSNEGEPLFNEVKKKNKVSDITFIAWLL